MSESPPSLYLTILGETCPGPPPALYIWLMTPTLGRTYGWRFEQEALTAFGIYPLVSTVTYHAADNYGPLLALLSPPPLDGPPDPIPAPL